MDTNKTVVLVVWAACAVAMTFLSGVLSTVGSTLFWLMVVAHLVEFVLKKGVMQKAGGSLGHHFVQTMLYGFFHWKPLEEAQAADGE